MHHGYFLPIAKGDASTLEARDASGVSVASIDVRGPDGAIFTAGG